MLEKTGHPYSINYFLDLNYQFIIYKLKFIIPYLAYYILNNIFFISGILILLILNFQKKKDAYIKIINFYFILNIIFIISAYLFRDMEIEFSIKTTMERIIFTSSGFYVFLIINYFKSLNTNS